MLGILSVALSPDVLRDTTAARVISDIGFAQKNIAVRSFVHARSELSDIDRNDKKNEEERRRTKKSEVVRKERQKVRERRNQTMQEELQK